MTAAARARAITDPDGAAVQIFPLPTDEASLERLLRDLFEQHWDKITFGPLIQGAAWEIRAPHAPTHIGMLDGYLTVAFGISHFHLCIGPHKGPPNDPAPEALARHRRTARAELYRRLDKSGAPVSWGLRLFNGHDEQQTTILLPNPFLAPDTDKILKTPDWSRLDLWDRLRARWLGLTDPTRSTVPAAGSAPDRTRRRTIKQPALDRAAGQAIGAPSAPRDWRHPLWLAFLVGASVVFSLGLACAVPLAAFAAAAALSLSRRDALLLILLVWLANQIVGFTLLDYPWTASTFAWGAALGIVAILATLAGHWMARRSMKVSRGLTFLATFLMAFAVYEAALFAFSATLLGGTEIYTAAIQGRIFAINAAAFVGLLVLNHLAATVGLARKLLIRLRMTEQHA